MSIPPVTKCENADGSVQYFLQFDSAWEGFDSFVKYLQKYWQADVSEQSDNVYSRRWVLRSGGVPISVYHDSQLGNYFVREDGVDDQTLLEKIEADLIHRMG